MKNICVLAFPGNNCEIETARALRKAGFSSEILRWNEDSEKILSADGLVIPGGFSFEDRSRSGVIAAKDPVAAVVHMMAKEGKPILGICNGAQILVEMGLVPGFHSGKVEMALARNRREAHGEILGTGFYHSFSYLKPNACCAWTQFDDILHLPIAHGEGQFCMNDETYDALCENEQDTLLYCDKEGSIDTHFPINPNGSRGNLAAVCNPKGNVMAMMPHPERIENGQKIFESLHAFFEKGCSRPTSITTPPETMETNFQKKESFNFELLIALKITDTTEKTIQATARRLFGKENIVLQRYIWWGISGNTSDVMEKIASCGEFFNENKEILHIRKGEKWEKNEGKTLVQAKSPLQDFNIIARENDDVLGEEKSLLLKKHHHLDLSLSSGVLWSFSGDIDQKEILKSHLLGNPITSGLYQ